VRRIIPKSELLFGLCEEYPLILIKLNLEIYSYFSVTLEFEEDTKNY